MSCTLIKSCLVLLQVVANNVQGAGTSSSGAATAFSQGKQIMMSLIKRYRRRLLGPAVIPPSPPPQQQQQRQQAARERQARGKGPRGLVQTMGFVAGLFLLSTMLMACAAWSLKMEAHGESSL